MVCSEISYGFFQLPNITLKNIIKAVYAAIFNFKPYIYLQKIVQKRI